MAHGHHGGHHGRSGGGRFAHGNNGGGGFGRDTGGAFPQHHAHSHRHVVAYRTPIIVTPQPIYTSPEPMYTRVSPRVSARTTSVCRWICMIFGFLIVAVATLAVLDSLGLLSGESSEVWTVKPNSSMPIEMDSFFTKIFNKEIQVKNLMSSSGPILYTFSEKPPLSRSVDYSVNFTASIEPDSYLQWAFWFNKGSELKISYNVPSSRLILAIPSGRDGLKKWIEDPRDPRTADFWRWLNGRGETSFTVPADDIYYIGLGNLNSFKTQASLDLNVHSLLYETANADSACKVGIGKVCVATIPFSGSNYAVLETPQDTIPGWDEEITYKRRWTTIWVIFGCFAAVGVCCCRKRTDDNAPDSESGAPAQLETPPSPAPPSSLAPSAPPLDSSVQADHSEKEPLIKNSYEKQGVQEEETLHSEGDRCAVCFDNPKDSFIDPCGHRSTCYSCGVSIQKGASPVCPICREPIRAVRKIYDV